MSSTFDLIRAGGECLRQAPVRFPRKESIVPCGRKRKLKKIATHKRKKKRRKNRHKTRK